MSSSLRRSTRRGGSGRGHAGDGGALSGGRGNGGILNDGRGGRGNGDTRRALTEESHQRPVRQRTKTAKAKAIEEDRNLSASKPKRKATMASVKPTANATKAAVKATKKTKSTTAKEKTKTTTTVGQATKDVPLDVEAVLRQAKSFGETINARDFMHPPPPASSPLLDSSDEELATPKRGNCTKVNQQGKSKFGCVKCAVGG